jgi:hypothetical protein
VGWFEGDDEEGANYFVSKIDYNLFKNSDNKTITFLARDGSLISIPIDKLKRIEFTYGSIIGTTSENTTTQSYASYVPTGILASFDLRESINVINYYQWSDIAKAYQIKKTANVGEANYTDVVNGDLYSDNTEYSGVNGFVYPMLCDGNIKIKKFQKGTLPKHVKGTLNQLDFDQFNLDLFGSLAVINGMEQNIPLSYYQNCRYCANPTTTEMTKPYCGSSAYLYIDKIAQIRVIYPEFFERFTDKSKDWMLPIASINQAFNQFYQTSTSPNDFCSLANLKPWEKFICDSFKVANQYQISLPINNTQSNFQIVLAKKFYSMFKYFVEQQNNASQNFWNNGNINNSSRNDLITWVHNTAMFNLEGIPNTKRDSCLVKILNAPTGNIQVVATIIDDVAESAVIKLLASAKTKSSAQSILTELENFSFSNSPPYNTEDFKGIKFLWTTFNDAGGDDNLTGVMFVISNLINIAEKGIYSTSKISTILEAAEPSLPLAEQNLFSFQQYSSDFTSRNVIKINGNDYNYNEMVTIQIAGSFSLGNKNYAKGTVITIPAIQARLFGYKNTCAVAENATWLAIDVGSCFLGIGGAKVLFTAGNWLRKAIVVSDLVGSTTGIVVQSLNNDVLSPGLRAKLQIASLALNVPMLATCIPKINKAVDDIDLIIDAKRFSVDIKDIETINLLRAEKTKLIVAAGLKKYQDFLNFIGINNFKLGYNGSTNINLTDFFANNGDDYIDVIIHYKNGNFVIAKEGKLSTTISIEELAGIINSAPVNKTVRLLSCNDLDAAKQLSLLTNKPFYASDGWVELTKTGNVHSEKAFKKFDNGNEVETLSHTPSTATGTEGVDFVRLGVNGAGNLVPSSLITKLTQQGATKLKAWTSGKSLSFIDGAGNVFTGANAESKIFQKLDDAIGNQNVLGTFEDTQGRLLVQCEGANRNTVYGVLTNKNGQQVVYKFEPTYKPSANPSIPVPLSANKLAPDFAGTQYLYPVTGTQKSIVKIKMSGMRNSTAVIQGDFELANIKAGFSGKTAPKFIDTNGNEIPYTWHHLDDFDPVTGECTMQLVRSDAHTGVQGMTHSGSVSQYKAYNGSGY